MLYTRNMFNSYEIHRPKVKGEKTIIPCDRKPEKSNQPINCRIDKNRQGRYTIFIQWKAIQL